VLPDLPDQANCRCYAVPDLGMPDYLKKDPAARSAYEKATAALVPDPASYADWWKQASPGERKAAVGARRYHAARDKLGREPRWADFLGPDGKLLSVSEIRGETSAEREQRLRQVKATLEHRQTQFEQVASQGYIVGPDLGPAGDVSPAIVLGGYPQDELLKMLDVGAPSGVEIVAADPQSLGEVSKKLFGRTLSEPELARLAGGLNRSEVLTRLEGEGLRLETIREGVRAVRWVGPDPAGQLKMTLYRTDVPERLRLQGLATRSVARSIQQAAKLGVQWAEATGVRSADEVGYFTFARYGFDAKLPRTWLKTYREDLKQAGLNPRWLRHLMATPDGREFWLVHGTTLDVKMDLRPGSPELFAFAQYLEDRRREGKAMAEARDASGGTRPDEEPILEAAGKNRLWDEITEEDAAILDRIWAENPRTEEDERRAEELHNSIVPGRAPMSPEIREVYEREQAEHEARRKAGLPPRRYRLVGTEWVEITDEG